MQVPNRMIIGTKIKNIIHNMYAILLKGKSQIIANSDHLGSTSRFWLLPNAYHQDACSLSTTDYRLSN